MSDGVVYVIGQALLFPIEDLYRALEGHEGIGNVLAVAGRSALDTLLEGCPLATGGDAQSAFARTKREGRKAVAVMLTVGMLVRFPDYLDDPPRRV